MIKVWKVDTNSPNLYYIIQINKKLNIVVSKFGLSY